MYRWIGRSEIYDKHINEMQTPFKNTKHDAFPNAARQPCSTHMKRTEIRPVEIVYFIVSMSTLYRESDYELRSLANMAEIF
jgi:hypothetical protein